MADAVQQSGDGARKACVACGEMIPVGATVCSHCQQRQVPEKGSPWKMIMAWVAGASAVVGLFASLSGQFHLFEGRHEQKTVAQAKMAVAQGQVKVGEYESAVRSYGEVLKESPLYAPALEGQVDAAMLWVENFQVLAPEGKDSSELAGAKLEEIMPVLDGGLARARVASKSSRAADVQAHLGWAHWLNWHIAEREFGPSAEQNLRAALVLDRSNVYANAMLGNWMLQNNGNFQEAVRHLNAAVGTGKARALVREMQLGGLVYKEVPGARAELVRAANDMRKNGEALEGRENQRILAFCFNPTVTDQAQLVESLGAVPEDEAWKTYLWLDDVPVDDATSTAQALTREFIYANLLEVSGKRAEALEKFRALQKELRAGAGMTFQGRVDDAVKRLGRG